MTLTVCSAHIAYARAKKPDALDITRGSGVESEGLFLAPSSTILSAALEARNRADELDKEVAKALFSGEITDLITGSRMIAEDLIDTSWEIYVPKFKAEMRRSFANNRAQWTALLARERVVLCCYCTDPRRCHRYILRSDIFPALGAIDGGEL